MNARVIIAGNNREFPSDAAQSCAAYLTQMARPSPPCGLEPAARSVVLPEDERAASFAYDLTAGRWIVPPPSLAKRDAGASAEPKPEAGAAQGKDDVIDAEFKVKE